MRIKFIKENRADKNESNIRRGQYLNIRLNSSILSRNQRSIGSSNPHFTPIPYVKGYSPFLLLGSSIFTFPRITAFAASRSNAPLKLDNGLSSVSSNLLLDGQPCSPDIYEQDDNSAPPPPPGPPNNPTMNRMIIPLLLHLLGLQTIPPSEIYTLSPR